MKSLLTKEYRDKIIEAIGFEIGASNAYKQLANYMEYIGYFGSRDFFQKESNEELKHYQTWADFMNQRGDVADVPTIVASNEKPKTLKECFKMYYERELELSEFYNEWYMSCDDASIHERLIDFVKIQRESVGEAGDFLAEIEACGDDKGALLLFDKNIQ